MRQTQRIRRSLLALVPCMLFGTTALAQDYPSRPVKIIIPFPAGGVLDSLTRAVAQRLQIAMGQPFIVENIAGASGNIGLANCARAPADGYTLCSTNSDTISLNPFMFKKMPVDPSNLTPVQRLATVDGVIFASAASQFSNMGDLLTAARAKPGGVAWGSFGVGSTSHLYMGWINKEKNVDLLHVPYKGSAPLLQAALSGEIQVGYLSAGFLMPHFRSGKLKALAAVSNKRFESLPNVPTLKESDFNFFVSSWLGMFAPPGTPKTIVERLNNELTKIMNDTTFRHEMLSPQGFRPATLPLDDFTQFVKQDRTVGEKLVHLTGITLD